MLTKKKEIIRLKEITFSYSDFADKSKILFSNLNLTLKEGEYTAIGGANGSGKTTLAALLKGILKPLSGEIIFRGANVTKNGINPEIGYIYSNPENQIVSPVVEDDIAFGLENMGVYGREIEDALFGALEKVNALNLQKELTHLLSGGEQQKINIAGILALNCKCIIFDEASSMLDPMSRRTLLKILKELNKEYGITIVQITHNLFELMSSDRVIYMEGGAIVFDGKWPLLFEKGGVSYSFTDKQRLLVEFIQKINKLTSEPMLFDCDMNSMIERLLQRVGSQASLPVK
ncbi:MAG: ATP-binding cassette domain-containing protein [Deltaproteobacteria bacterium]|nr:ATP-binding cassette domain-containing protein [Deltaproteobacteria bacterium]